MRSTTVSSVCRLVSGTCGAFDGLVQGRVVNALCSEAVYAPRPLVKGCILGCVEVPHSWMHGQAEGNSETLCRDEYTEGLLAVEP